MQLTLPLIAKLVSNAFAVPVLDVARTMGAGSKPSKAQTTARDAALWLCWQNTFVTQTELAESFGMTNDNVRKALDRHPDRAARDPILALKVATLDAILDRITQLEEGSIEVTALLHRGEPRIAA